MEHFVRIVMEKQDSLTEGLNEDVFPESYVYETQQDATVIEIPLPQALSEDSMEEFVNRLADHMFNEGYEDFDIEVSTDVEEDLQELTFDGNDFYEEFGVLGFTEDSSEDWISEAEYQGKTVTLNKPIRSSNGPKKFHVYVKNPKGNVVKVNFGDPNMEIKSDSPDAKRSFRARHNCDNPGPKHKARYWSCKNW